MTSAELNVSQLRLQGRFVQVANVTLNILHSTLSPQARTVIALIRSSYFGGMVQCDICGYSMRLLWSLNVFKKGKWSNEEVYYCSNCHGLRAEDHPEPYWLGLTLKS